MTLALKGQLVSGDVAMAQCWNGDTRQAQRENPNIAFALPREGSLIFNDYMVRARATRRIPPPPPPSSTTSSGPMSVLPSARRRGMARQTVPRRSACATRFRFRRRRNSRGSNTSSTSEPSTALWDRIWTEVKAAV